MLRKDREETDRVGSLFVKVKVRRLRSARAREEMAECRTGLSCSQANQDMKREEPGEMMGIETAALMHPQ